MTILVHHRALWEITRDKTHIGTYMRVARFSSVTQSFPTLCDPMDTRPTCPSPTHGAYSHSCPSSWWCHWTTSLPVIPFSCLQSFPESGSFPTSLFITSVRVASRVRVSSHSEVASNPPNPREWLVILSTGWSCLASFGFWSCFGVFPSLWPFSTSASPLIQKDLITLNFKNLLLTVQGWRSWWEAVFLCAHSEPFEFRKQGSEAAEETQTSALLETQPRLQSKWEWPRFRCRWACPGPQTPGRSTSQSTQTPQQLLSCCFWSDFIDFLGFPGGSAVRNLPAVQEIWVPSLSQEDPLEKEMATHSSVLAWEIRGQRSLEGYSPWVHKESDTT